MGRLHFAVPKLVPTSLCTEQTLTMVPLQLAVPKLVPISAQNKQWQCPSPQLVPTSAQNKHWQCPTLQLLHSSKIGAHLCTEHTLAVGIPYILRFQNWCPPLHRTNISTFCGSKIPDIFPYCNYCM